MKEPDENYENEDVHESLVQNHESEQEVAHVSRWSKYTDQTAEGPNGHEDEEEDENFYTEIRTDSEAKEPGKGRKSPLQSLLVALMIIVRMRSHGLVVLAIRESRI
ncbi:hypothetical protein cypCar_00026063, partial [Cyprinus carpio]